MEKTAIDMKKEVMILAGEDFLVDGGATASFFYGPLQPGK